MEDITPTLPTAVPETTSQPVAEAVPVSTKPNRSLGTILIVGGIIVIILFITALVRPMGKKPITIVPTPTPTIVPTPTPQRILSAIATTSAFLELDSAVASLSAGVTSVHLDDPSLVPPTLDLPLRF